MSTLIRYLIRYLFLYVHFASAYQQKQKLLSAHCLQNVGEREKGEIEKFKRERETRNLNVSGKCSKSALGYLKTSFRPLMGFLLL